MSRNASRPVNQALAQRLRRHVHHLSHEIGDRSMARPDALQRAASYIEQAFTDMGYAVRPQRYDVEGEPATNLLASIEDPASADALVVVGAHYDSCANPGADDNASGIAGLLELARLLAASPQRGRLLFAAFANEEPPYFQTEAMGSAVFVREALREQRAGAAPIRAAVILEMIGYYTSTPRSQHYPPLFGLFYPNRGDFLAVVGNLRFRGLVTQTARAIARHGGVPVESIAAPEAIEGVDWSDQWAFWQAGIPAVMLTDTAFFRNPHYHLPTDTWDTLDYQTMAGAVEAIASAVSALAAEPHAAKAAR